MGFLDHLKYQIFLIPFLIGNFDGVHIGYQVIKKAKISKKKKIGVLTFEPHPKCFLKVIF